MSNKKIEYSLNELQHLASLKEGEVVIFKEHVNQNEHGPTIGHVVRFELNALHEIIVIVRVALQGDYTLIKVHPANVELLSSHIKNKADGDLP